MRTLLSPQSRSLARQVAAGASPGLLLGLPSIEALSNEARSDASRPQVSRQNAGLLPAIGVSAHAAADSQMSLRFDGLPASRARLN